MVRVSFRREYAHNRLAGDDWRRASSLTCASARYEEKRRRMGGRETREEGEREGRLEAEGKGRKGMRWEGKERKGKESEREGQGRNERDRREKISDLFKICFKKNTSDCFFVLKKRRHFCLGIFSRCAFLRLLHRTTKYASLFFTSLCYVFFF